MGTYITQISSALLRAILTIRKTVCEGWGTGWWKKVNSNCQENCELEAWGLGYLPGGHLPPQNSDIYHPQKKTFARRTTATPIFFFFFFWRIFLGFFDLQLMEVIKYGKEEVLDEVVMEHIK